MVFLSDLPVIISGAYCGFLDPQEQIWQHQSGKRFRLTSLQNTPDVLAPFAGLCGFQIGSTDFSGQTLFRFPLRNTRSDLSEKCYDIDDIQKLIIGLREEVKYLLLFLRSVQSITITEKLSNESERLLLSVNVSECDSGKRQLKQSNFIDEIYSTFVGPNPYDVQKLVSSAGSFSVVVKEAKTGESKHQWLVVHQVGSMNQIVRQHAAKQHVLPWVGAAIEFSSATIDSVCGRLFCFLPMPCEATAPVPVHVNGTFALSDSRRALKWPAGERKNDPQAEWNKLLVEHCFPSCYVKLLLSLIKIETVIPKEVYMTWPDVQIVEDVDEWCGILPCFLKELFKHKIIHSNINGGCWVTLDDAVLVPQDENIPNVVEDALLSCRKTVARVDDVVWRAIEYYNSITRRHSTVISPSYTRSILLNNVNVYRHYNSCDKIKLLGYCLGDKKYEDMVGLELLPLANGAFVRFNARVRYYTPLFLCTNEFPQDLLPDCRQFLVNLDDSNLHKQLKEVAMHHCTQLQLLQVADVARLLKQSIPSGGYLNDSWLRLFWTWVQNYQLSYFENIPLVPVDQNKVAKLTKSAGVVYLPANNYVQTELKTALSRYQVKMANAQMHYYLTHRQLLNYLHTFNGAGLLDAISLVSYNIASVTPTIAEATALQEFFDGSLHFIYQKMSIFKQLSIFKTLQNTLCSINAASKTYNGSAIAEHSSYDLKIEYLPQSPLVLSQTGNRHRLLQAASVQYLNKIQYLCQIVFSKVKQGGYFKQNTESLMSEVLSDFSSYAWRFPSHFSVLVESVKNLPFLFNHGRWKCPKDLFNPSDSDLCNLFEGEAVFPVAPFDDMEFLDPLKRCGLRQIDSVTAQEICDIVNNIKTHFSSSLVAVEVIKHRRAKAVMHFLNEHPLFLQHQVTQGRYWYTLQAALESCARDYCWLPVCCTPPSCYSSCLVWMGTQYKQCLASSRANLVVLHTNTSDDPMLMGSEMIFVDGCLPQKFANSLSCSSKSRAVAIINHLRTIIKNKSDFDCNLLEKLVKNIYIALNQLSWYDVEVPLANITEWIWAGEKIFVSPNVMGIGDHPNFRQNLRPFIYTLPSSLYQSITLFRRAGVTEQVSSEQILSVLKEDLTTISSSDAWSLVRAILNWAVDMSNDGSLTLDDHDLLVPVECTSSNFPQLQPVEKVVFTDNEFLKSIAMSSGEEFTLVHSSVSTSVARALGVTPLSTHLDISEDIMEDAGQHEPLIQRLQNILREYKDGLTIIKELLQNADDAGATELNIVYDARHHSTSNLFFPHMDKAHGPALVVHNNASFTDEDFANITKLAGATKANKTLKIGKFGLGFCSVYHITDVPSFVSRDYLYIFDPALKHLADAVQDRSQPGKKIKFTSRHFVRSQQLSPYKNLFNFQPSENYGGTIFRFPFRDFPSQISEDVYTEDTVDKLKDALKEEGSKLLLFLNNINRITFNRIRANEQGMTQELVVQRNQSDFKIECDACLKEISILQNRTVYRHEKWLVSDHSQDIFCSVSRQEKFSTAAVACLLVHDEDKTTVSEIDGEVFCFLPLSVNTGLPVHVSGNFGVINNRRGIWTSDSSNIKGEMEVEWNQQLMKVTVAQAYIKLLKSLMQLSKIRVIHDYKFYSLWPLEPQLTTKNPWNLMVSVVYSMLGSETLFHSSSIQTWLTLENSQFLAPDFLSVEPLSALPDCISVAIQHLQLPVVYLPPLYLSHIELLQDNVISRDMFVNTFFDQIEIFTFDMVKVRNNVLLLILRILSFEIDKSSKPRLRRTLQHASCIPCTPDGLHLARADQLVDPNEHMCTLFDPDDGKFPIKVFCNDPAARRAMICLGLVTESVPWPLLIECAKGIEELLKTKKTRTKGLIRVQKILQCIQENIEWEGISEEAKQLAKIRFLPVMSKPKAYPLFWKGEKHQLLCGSELAYYEEKTGRFSNTLNMPCLVGTQLALLSTLKPPDGCGWIYRQGVKDVLGLISEPKIETVLEHFFCVVQELKDSKKKLQSNSDWVKQTCIAVYSFLNEKISASKRVLPTHGTELAIEQPEEPTEEEKILISYRQRPFIFTGTTFVEPSVVAQKWTVNGPYLYSLPYTLAPKSNLIKVLAIKNSFSEVDLFYALDSMHRDFNGRLPDHCHKVVEDIMQALTKCVPSEPVEVDKYLPDESYQLHPVKKLSFNDAPWCKPDTDCTFVHHLIGRQAALAFGVKPVRSRFLEMYTSSNQEFGLPFGQKEKLTDRIKNILRDYPLDSTFLKELIQNADDAKATKMCVILDKRTHGHKRVLSENWSDLQGPALLVWNDAEFTENDLKGIQQLGLGSKRDDSESIGQFGIGFNVVYHITDCPSFITGGKTLCILDPHHCYAPGATENEPGRRLDKLDKEFWDNFSDLKKAYLRDAPPGIPNEQLQKGSLFRFPLRHNRKLVEKSELVDRKVFAMNKPLGADSLGSELYYWVSQVKDSLLFLNHLTQFEFFVISDDSSVVLESSFEVHIDDSYKKLRTEFHKRAKEFGKSNKPEIITYCLSITAGRSEHRTREDWLVQQGVGDVKNNCENHWSFINQIIPKHGLAALLSSTKQHSSTKFKGKVFCFLPLPISTTNLPVHVNGQFILNNSRRNLWSSDQSDEKRTWNDNLIQAISSSYASFLIIAQVSVGQQMDAKTLKIDLERYYNIFPYWNLPEEEQLKPPTSEVRSFTPSKNNPEKEWKVLAQSVFNKLMEENAPVLASIEQQRGLSSVKWNVLVDKNTPFIQAYFIPDTSNDGLKKLLIKIGMTITCAPSQVRSHFEVMPPEAAPNEVFNFYIKFYQKIVQTHIPCHISQTLFKTAETFTAFTRYVVSAPLLALTRRYPQSPFSHPLLMTADEHLREFCEANKVFSSKYSGLFPASSSKFLHSGIFRLHLCKDYFAEPESISLEVILDIFRCNMSYNLVSETMIENVNGALIHKERLKDIWKCICDDPVFEFHQQSIMKHCALIPATNHSLFSADSKFLPLVLTKDCIHSRLPVLYSAFEVLKTLCMPVGDCTIAVTYDTKLLPTDTKLSEKVKAAIESYCAKMSCHSVVLKSLYHWHCMTKLLDQLPHPDTMIKILFNYFSYIHFQKDYASLEYIKSLPLFKAKNGKYTSICGKKVYTWPTNCCEAGYDKWANLNSVVFLEKFGEWRTLCTEISSLGGEDLCPMDVYTQLVFNAFNTLDQSERKQHLTYIRDELFSDEKYYQKQHRYFFQKLRQLPCLADASQTTLLPICEFCDPRIKIFNLFGQYFKFPDEEYRDDRWLNFFESLGLKTKLENREFVTFCRLVANGAHSMLSEASDELLKYLFSVQALYWHRDSILLAEIGQISFAKPDQLSRLSWIKAPCSPVNQARQLTSLKGAAVSSCAKLVWTVLPVVSVPYISQYDLKQSENFSSFDALEWNTNLCQWLGMITNPSAAYVHKNVLCISSTGLGKFTLFTKYNPEYTHQPSLRDNIVDIISDNLTFLQENDSAKLKELEMVNCIPVDAEGRLSTTFSKPVLVNSCQVVHSIGDSEQCLEPYINTLPRSMIGLAQILAEVGVTPNIKIKHLQHLLQVIHNQIGSNTLHTNHQLTVRTAVSLLLQMCSKDSQDANALTDLYLPCFEGTLKLSTMLVVVDSPRYKINLLNFSSTGYSVFYLPRGTSSGVGILQRGARAPQIERDIFHLPKHVRPKGILLSTEERLNDEAVYLDEYTPLCEQIINMARLHEQIKIALSALLLHNDVINEQQKSELFLNEISEILSTLQVKAVNNLMSNVYFTLVNPKVLLGTLEVPFLISEQANGYLILSVNAKQNREGYRFWNDLALHMCIYVARRIGIDPITVFKFQKCLADCLKVKDIEDLYTLTEGLSLDFLVDEFDEDMLNPLVRPRLGQDLPGHLLAFLDQDINHIFRGQEWVGYEINEDHFVFAIVLCHVTDKDEKQENVQRRYLIQVGDNEEERKNVSALDLYKILELTAKDNELTAGGELVSYDAGSTPATLSQANDSLNLLQLKRNICEELKVVWKLSESDRKKAVKRLLGRHGSASLCRVERKNKMAATYNVLAFKR